jgi:putative FmdB family regulatory protein
MHRTFRVIRLLTSSATAHPTPPRFLTWGAGPTIRLAVMPTYEYVCSKCGLEFEQFQPIADQPLKVCPAGLCPRKKWGRGKVKRKISAGAGLIFKGSGFYITDNRSEKYKEAAKKDSAAATAPKPSGEAKPAPSGEARPAPKPNVKPAKAPAKS